MDIDVAATIGALDRRVETRDRDGQPVQVVLASRRYDTSVEDLWDALTDPERLPRWFLPISGDLRLGGRYQLEGNAGGEITGCEPPTWLAVTWEMGEDVSWVEVFLSEAEGGARLRLEHSANVSPAFAAQYGPGATGVGWEMALMGLGLHLATGQDNDAAAYHAWTVSAQGKDFSRGSSAGWCEAAIANGEDGATARAAAERTRAFYTGETSAEDGEAAG